MWPQARSIPLLFSGFDFLILSLPFLLCRILRRKEQEIIAVDLDGIALVTFGVLPGGSPDLCFDKKGDTDLAMTD